MASFFGIFYQKSDKDEKFNNITIKYKETVSKYPSIFKLGVVTSVLMLVLFIIYSLSVIGILSKKQMFKNYKLRNVSLKLLLSGAVIYFILSILLIIVCSIFLIPGGLIRSFVCKPLTQLEDDSLFQYFKNIDFHAYYQDKFNKSYVKELMYPPVYNINKLNVKQLISDCRVSNTSSQIDNLNDLWIPVYWNLKRGNLVNSLKYQISNGFKSESLIGQVNYVLDEYFNDFAINDIKKLNHKTYKKDVNYSTIKNLITSMKNQVKDMENINRFYLKKSKNFDQILDLKFVKESVYYLNQIFNNVIDDIPYCDYIPFFYDTVKSPCLNFVDNFNSFGGTLFFCFIIHFILAIFAILQYDLLRKYYSYNDSINEVL
jgi:hypothetical protein